MRGSKTEWGGEGSGKWRLRVYVERSPTGRPVQVSRNFRGGARAADDALRVFVAEVEKSRTPERNATLAVLLERWMAQIEPKVSAYTLKTYRHNLDNRLIPELGKIRLAKLTAKTLDDTYQRWLKEGLSGGTVRKHHNMLSAALHQAVKWDWVSTAVTEKADPPSGRTNLARSISTEEFARILAAAKEKDDVLAIAVAFAAVTGCRRGELCAIRWSGIDLTSGTLTVSESLTHLDGEATHGATKSHQVRRMRLDAITVGVLEGHMDWQRAYAERVDVPLDPNPYLLSLSPRADRPFLPSTLTHRFKQLMVELKMPYHFHELRHFSATSMIAAGVNVRTVATRLGHSTPTLTLNTYAHAVEAADEAAARVLGAALSPAALAPPAEG